MKVYEPKKYSLVTDKELLQFIRYFYKEYKRAPLTSDFENTTKYPHFKTYYRHFKYYRKENKLSSWNDILELAGVSPLNMRDLWSAWQYLVKKSAQLLEGNCLFQYCGFSLNFKPDIYIPSKNKIIDAATSNYKDEHKLKQYKKGIQYVDTIEYWCLNKNNTPGYDFPNLKYIFANELIEILSALGQFKLCEDIAKNDLLNFIKTHKRLPKYRELGFPNTTYTQKVYTKYWGSISNCAKILNDDSIIEYLK